VVGDTFRRRYLYSPYSPLDDGGPSSGDAELLLEELQASTKKGGRDGREAGGAAAGSEEQVESLRNEVASALSAEGGKLSKEEREELQEHMDEGEAPALARIIARRGAQRHAVALHNMISEQSRKRAERRKGASAAASTADLNGVPEWLKK
jgi:hypothetical protein